MPYTPPSLGSSSASYQSSPPGSPGPRPSLPRSNSSASYLSRHRRSPSWQGHSQDRSRIFSSSQESNNACIRQSPPPVTDSAMPAGAVISPPDSTQNSSDDERPAPKSTRQVEGLQELEKAVRSIDMSRVPSSPPNGQAEPRNKIDLHLELPQASSADVSFREPQSPIPPRLSASARKISHSRSTTESSFLDLRNTRSANASLAGSDESDDDLDGANEKPTLLRKKSGELVKPAIRPPSRRKHSSMPGTPTYSKAVRFNDDIEQVKHFLQVDRPIAVSAGTSPIGGYEDETEFPFGYAGPTGAEWDMCLANFPRDSFERLSSLVRIERIFLSPDQKNLIGLVAAANLAFHKQVVVRFTLDQWQTTSEVVAEFNHDLRQKPREDGYDQFNFSIKLSDQANLESKTMFICVRYNVNGQEYWDNNNSMNYQVEFAKKKHAQAASKAPPQGVGTRPIPRSRHNSSSGRPRSIPSFDDDFSSSFDPSSVIRFRNNVSNNSRLPDTKLEHRQAPSGQQFGSRYDFSASLSVALSQAQAQLGEHNSSEGAAAGTESKMAHRKPETRQLPPAVSQYFARPGYMPPANSGTESPRPDTLLANKQSLDSRAYQDFVSKFCFFGSSKTTNQASSSKLQPYGNIDGAQDEYMEDQTSLSEQKYPTNGLQPDPESPTSSDLMNSSNELSNLSPLPASGNGIEPHAHAPISWGFSFPPEPRTGAFTPESQTPTAIQG